MLLSKIKAHGVIGEIWSWIKDWLSNRLQRVINGKSSRWITVESCVPQGSVLGPILFLIYINDIDDNMISKVLKFADYTKLISAVATDQDIDNVRHLCNLASWSREWMMLFNVEQEAQLFAGIWPTVLPIADDLCKCCGAFI